MNAICVESSSDLLFPSVGVAADSLLLDRYCSPASNDVNKYLHQLANQISQLDDVVTHM